MTIRRLPGVGLRYGWKDFEDEWNRSGGDLNWAWLSALLSGGVDDIVAALPAGPNEGNVYILNSEAALNPTKVALYTLRIELDGAETGLWDYLTPPVGLTLYVRARAAHYRWNGTTWVPAKTASVAFYVGQSFVSDQAIVKTLAPVRVEYPSGVPGSYATCEVAADALYVISIRRNGSPVGNLRFEAGSLVGVFQVSSGFTVNPGDALTFQAPNVPDENFTGLTVTFTGVRKEA